MVQEDCTPLHVACSCRCVDAALCLLNAQAAVDLIDNVMSNYYTVYTVYKA